jgi:hypothetical protein
MIAVSLTDAKASLNALIDWAEAGETVTITPRGTDPSREARRSGTEVCDQPWNRLM